MADKITPEQVFEALERIVQERDALLVQVLGLTAIVHALSKRLNIERSDVKRMAELIASRSDTLLAAEIMQSADDTLAGPRRLS